jgi:hypothetical protein
VVRALVTLFLPVGTFFDPHAVAGWLGPVMAVVAALALGWAISRAQAVTAWKESALGRKEENEILEGRLRRAEETAVVLQQKIVQLEQKPDLTVVMRKIEEAVELVRRNGDNLRQHDERLKGVEEAVRDLAQRWG